MAKKKVSSAHQKELYKRYTTERRWQKNKIKNLNRHLMKYPNDTVAEKAIEVTSKRTGPTGPRKPTHPGTVKAEKFFLYPEKLPRSIKDWFING